MREIRVYLEDEFTLNQPLKIEDQAFTHLIKVLRLKVKANFIAFNGDGKNYLLNILSVEKKYLIANVLSYQHANNLSPLKSTLYLALAKPDHMDWSIQKCTELGIHTIVPFISERTQGRLKQKQLEKKYQHWKKVIISACEQSGRAELPNISLPLTLAQLIDALKVTSNNYLLHFDKQAICFNQIKLNNHHIGIICGAEGGFTETEVNLIQAHAKIVTLGSRILRTETAAVTALSILQNKFGDIS